MGTSELVAAVVAGKALEMGAPPAKCVINGTRTRARLDGVAVCQGCFARARGEARKVPTCDACGERHPSVSLRADDRIVCDACDAKTWGSAEAETPEPCHECRRVGRHASSCSTQPCPACGAEGVCGCPSYYEEMSATVPMRGSL